VRLVREATSDPRFLPPTVATVPASATVPSPRRHFGTIIGAPGVMHRTSEIYGYFRALAAASPRVRVETIGQTEEGREMIVAAEGGQPPDRDAFDKARRQLEDYVREIRGDVKLHDLPSHGHVSKLFEDFGFIETPDGREVYFHANSLVGTEFESLEIGQEVRFVEEPGDEGTQATSIHLLGRHHHIID
jgi:cold shock CspA family protein